MVIKRWVAFSADKHTQYRLILTSFVKPRLTIYDAQVQHSAVSVAAIILLKCQAV